MPVTAIKFFGLFLLIFAANSARSFLGFLLFKYKILFLNPSLIFSEIIILEPFLIASLINLLPSRLFPFIAKKM